VEAYPGKSPTVASVPRTMIVLAADVCLKGNLLTMQKTSGALVLMMPLQYLMLTLTMTMQTMDAEYV
jgi:hypothetical protein